MDRKLASVQTIAEILPHPNADKLEIAKVLGWTCVVLKDQFKKYQQVVYIETDSILPEGKAEWEFMRPRKFHVKTIKLRGQVSQGLVFPLSILPLMDIKDPYPTENGIDVTEILCIKKYEVYVPAQLSGIQKGNFPDFLHKTDEIRIQAVPDILKRYQGKPFYVTEKVDGSSMTVYLKDGEFGVCSRNFEMKETEDNAFWKTARALDLENKLRSFGKNVALQGELVGPGVQKNKYGLEKLNFFVFNIFNIDSGLHYDFEDFEKLIRFFGLTSVPVVGLNYTLPTTVEELVFYSQANSVLNNKTQREGIVLRPNVNCYDEDLHGRLSFKVINPEFLLKYDE